MTTDEAEAWSRIRFHLENQVGFWFALVVGDDARPRARLRDQAERWCREQGKPFFVHAPPPDRLARLAVELASGVEPGIHWIRTDGPGWLIEEWDEAASQLFLAMNERREAYRKRLDGGVIIEGRESLKRLLRDLSPDLFSIRAFIAEPGASVEATPRVLEWRAPARSGMEFMAQAADPDRELERAAKLAAATSLGARRARRNALITAAWGLAIGGRLEEAERCIDTLIREQVDDISRDTDKVTLNVLHGLIAQAKGNLDLSLNRLDDALCTLKHRGGSGTAGELAVLQLILGARGEVLETRGDLHAAEASFREQHDVLQALTKIGHSDRGMQLRTFVVRRRIAVLVSDRREHAAAEQMLLESLEVLERTAKEHPTESPWWVELLEHYFELSNTLAARGDLAKAREAGEAALQIAQRFADDDGDERWSSMLWKLLVRLSTIASRQGDSTAALDWAKRCTAIALQRVDERADDTSFQWKVAVGYSQQADALIKQGDLDGAAAALLSAWYQVRVARLLRADISVAGLLVVLHVRLGLTWLARDGDPQAASSAGDDDPRSVETRRARQGAGLLKRAISLGDRCIVVAPRDRVVRILVSRACDQLATLLAQQGKHRRARQVRRRGRKLRRQR